MWKGKLVFVKWTRTSGVRAFWVEGPVCAVTALGGLEHRASGQKWDRAVGRHETAGSSSMLKLAPFQVGQAQPWTISRV